MPSSSRVWAVIVAAGEGRRFGGASPKQFADLAGKPMLLHAIAPFRDHPNIEGVTLVLPEAFVHEPPGWLAALAGSDMRLVAGGDSRTDSVRQGVAATPADVATVVVHDGARPLITRDGISRVLDQVTPERGAVAGRRLTDALKQVDDAGLIVRSLDRSDLWRAETPQAFPRAKLLDVYRRAQADGVTASDSAELCERYGVAAVMVELHEPNLKVTHPTDLQQAAALIVAWRG